MQLSGVALQIPGIKLPQREAHRLAVVQFARAPAVHPPEPGGFSDGRPRPRAVLAHCKHCHV